MDNKMLKFIKIYLITILKFHLIILLTSTVLFKNANANERSNFNEYKKVSISNPKWTSIFQNASLIIINGLLKNNYQNLGDLDLNTLKTEILSLNWRFIRGNNIKAGADGSGSTAGYSIIDKLIIVSLEEWLNTEPSLRAIIALHEALGALGYRDENYQISLTLAQLNALSSKDVKEIQNLYDINFDINIIISYLISAPFLKNPIEKTQPVFMVDGGVTGLPGGGDIRALTTKFFLLTTYPLLMKIQNITDPTLLKKTFYLIINCEIESTTESIHVTDLKINIDNTTVSFNQDHLKITIPKNIQFFHSRNQTQINWSAQYSLNLLNKILSIIEGPQ